MDLVLLSLPSGSVVNFNRSDKFSLRIEWITREIHFQVKHPCSKWANLRASREFTFGIWQRFRINNEIISKAKIWPTSCQEFSANCGWVIYHFLHCLNIGMIVSFINGMNYYCKTTIIINYWYLAVVFCQFNKDRLIFFCIVQ